MEALLDADAPADPDALADAYVRLGDDLAYAKTERSGLEFRKGLVGAGTPWTSSAAVSSPAPAAATPAATPATAGSASCRAGEDVPLLRMRSA